MVDTIIKRCNLIPGRMTIEDHQMVQTDRFHLQIEDCLQACPLLGCLLQGCRDPRPLTWMSVHLRHMEWDHPHHLTIEGHHHLLTDILPLEVLDSLIPHLPIWFLLEVPLPHGYTVHHWNQTIDKVSWQNNPLYANGLFHLASYNEPGMVHCTCLGF